MKKNKLLLLFIISIIGIISYACINDKVEENVVDGVSNLEIEQYRETKIPTDMGGIKFGSLVLPKGTISTISQNGSRLDFKLPKNYIYAATDNTGKAFFTHEGSYTCTSTCSGGCDVVKFGNEIGCSACPEGNSDPCVGERGKNMQKNGAIEHQIGYGQNGGIINLEYGISFITHQSKKTKNENSPNFDVLISHPKIKMEFDLFLNKIWGDKTPNLKNAKEVLVDVYGEIISLYIPLEMHKNSTFQFINAAKISCKCSSGDSGCKLEPIKKGIMTIGQSCKAGSCTSCTMTW